MVLPSLSIPGGHHLVDEGDRVAIHSRDGARVAEVNEILRWRLQQRDSDKVLTIEYGNGSGSKVVPPEVLKVKGWYKQIYLGTDKHKLKVYEVHWCTPSLWWEARLLGSAWSLEPRNFLASMMKNHWKRWVNLVEGFTQPCRGLLRRRDPRGGDTSYLRHLPEATLSTPGLLLVTVWRTRSARGDGHR